MLASFHVFTASGNWTDHAVLHDPRDHTLQSLMGCPFIKHHPSPSFQECCSILWFLIKGKTDNLHRRVFALDQACGFNTVQSRHVHIHKDHIRTKLVSEMNRLRPICCLANQLHVSTMVEIFAQSLPNHRVVIDEEHPNAFRRPMILLLDVLNPEGQAWKLPASSGRSISGCSGALRTRSKAVVGEVSHLILIVLPQFLPDSSIEER